MGELQVGVDLGTAYLVLTVLDGRGWPLAGEYQFAEVARDGLIVDFHGAVQRLKAMKAQLEGRIGRPLAQAQTGYPPGVPAAERRATANVLEAVGLECIGLVDEPTAANRVLKLSEGAIVDVGGGTTGIAVVEHSQVVYTADEATGGTHFSLVIAGALDIEFAAAEQRKKDPERQRELFPVVEPVMEKVASIVQRHTREHSVPELVLVGGTTAFPGMDRVIESYTGIPTRTAPEPMLITPLGIGMHIAGANG